jgi:prenyltransferase beta subunit
MPIKSTNSNKTFLTKKIYINWCEQEVLTEEEYEKHLNEVMEEMLKDEALLGEWICDNLNYRETGRLAMDKEYHAEVMAEFEGYCRDRVQEEDGEWEEVEVTF